MKEIFTLKYWEPFLKESVIKDKSLVNVIYGVPSGESSLLMESISQAENVLVYGTTGSGKSVFLHTFIKSNMLTASPNDMRLVLVDSKRVEFCCYKNSEYLYWPPIEKEEDLLKVINNLLVECHKRESLLKGNDFTISHDLPRIIMVIDEYADIQNEIIDVALSKLLNVGYKFGIHVVLASQRAINLISKINLTNDFKTIVALTNFDDKLTRKLIGEYIELNGRGDSILLHDGKIVRCQGLYTPYN